MPVNSKPTTDIETPLFYDVGRIVDPESAQGKHFASEMEALVKRLYGSEFDPDKHSFRFLLADDPSFNAYTVTQAKPHPVIVLHKGLIEGARSYDEMAAVVAHEIGHNIVHRHLGFHNNTKAEELAADIYAVKKLADAGLNAHAVEELAAKLGEHDSPRTAVMNALLDVHPLAKHRESAAAQARVTVERQALSKHMSGQATLDGSSYTTKRPNTPMPHSLLETAKSAAFTSTADIKYRAQLAEYEKMPIQAKLNWLVEQVETTKTIGNELFDGEARKFYTEQITTLFEAISVADAPTLHEPYQHSFDRLMESGLWNGDGDSSRLYKVAYKGLGKQFKPQKLEPIGEFRALYQSVNGYINATTPEHALVHANEILAFRKKYATALTGNNDHAIFYRNNYFDGIDIAEIHYPTVDEARAMLAAGKTPSIPLFQHDQWSTQREEYKSFERVNQLLVGGFGATSAPGIISANEHPYSHNGASYFEQFEMDGGQIRSVWPDPVEMPAQPKSTKPRRFQQANAPESLIEERIRLDHQAAWEKQLLREGVRWDLLTSNQDQFFRIYGAAVNPVATMQPYEHPFAHALMEQMNALATSHPELMTRENRRTIFDRLGQGSPRLGGYDIDHPYIREFLALRSEYDHPLVLANGTKIDPVLPHSRLVAHIRIDPFEKLPADFPFILDHMPVGYGELQADSKLASALKIQEFRALDAKIKTEGVAVADLTTAVKAHSDIYDIQRANSQNPLAASTTEPLLSAFASHCEAALLAAKEKDLPSLIEQFNELKIVGDFEANKFRSQPELQNRCARTIVSRIGELTDLDERATHINELLNQKFQAPDPETRKALAKLIVNDIRRQLPSPHDDGTVRFANAVTKLSQDYSKKTGGLLHSEIFTGLADAVVAQPKLAYKMRDQNNRKMAGGAIKDDIFARIGEAAFHEIKESPTQRAAMLEYLSCPLSPESTHQTWEKFIYRGAFFKETYAELQHDALDKFHQNFWDMPLEGRIAILNDVVFPPGTPAKTVTHITNRILDRMLVDTDSKPFQESDFVLGKGAKAAPRSKGSQSSNTAKLIVESYINTVAKNNPKEAQMLVSGLLSAEHTRAPGETMRTGQTLNVVLSNMGPAGAKLLQAIHSHPSTPEDIRNDLKYSKIEHAKPSRWDAIELMENAGLLDSAKTAHVGKVIGAGSFGVTLLNEAPDGTQYADTILRPNADKISAREFAFMLDASKIIAKADPRLAPVANMIGEAQYSARIETKMNLAAKQNVVAKQVMDGIQVTVKGDDGSSHTFTHRVMDLVEHGTEYKRAQVAYGNDFLRLPENATPQYRRAAAYAMASMQLTQRMAGMPVDRDRHGGNIKIDGNTINHFDFGMTDVVLPSDQQKQALGKVIAQASKDAAIRGDFTEHLLNRIDKTKATPEVGNFLAGVKREMLAMGDYFNVPSDTSATSATKSPPPKELTGILGNALYGEHVDPVIQQAFKNELGMFSGAAENYFRKAMAESPVEISNVPTRANLKMPELTTDEHTIVSRSNIKPLHENIAHTHGGIPHQQVLGQRAGGALGAAMAVKGMVDALHSDGQPTDGLTKAAQATSTTGAAAALVQSSANTANMVVKEGTALNRVLGATEGVLGKVATPIAVASGVLVTAHGIANGDKNEVAAGVGGTSGALIGAQIGAVAGAEIGTVFGPVGTAVGGVAGGVVGGIAGSEAGQAVGHVYIAGVETSMQVDTEIVSNLIHSDAGQAVINNAAGQAAIAGVKTVAKGAGALANEVAADAKIAAEKLSDSAKWVAQKASELAATDAGKSAIKAAETSLNAVGHLTGVSQAIEIGKGAVDLGKQAIEVYHSEEVQAAMKKGGEIANAAIATVSNAADVAIHSKAGQVAIAAVDAVVGVSVVKNAGHMVADGAASAMHAASEYAQQSWDETTKYAMDTKDYWIGNNSILQKTLTKQGIDKASLVALDKNHDGTLTAQEAREYLLAHGEKTDAVKTLTATELGMHLASQLSAEHLAAAKVAGAQGANAGAQDTSYSAAGETPAAPVVANAKQPRQAAGAAVGG